MKVLDDEIQTAELLRRAFENLRIAIAETRAGLARRPQTTWHRHQVGQFEGCFRDLLDGIDYYSRAGFAAPPVVCPECGRGAKE